jgi:hypothetical protein
MNETDFFRVRHPASDTRLLIVGVLVGLALAAYLAVAFARTHPSSSGFALSLTNKFAPWVPKYHSTLALVPRRNGGGIAVHVAPRWIGAYGAVVPTLVAQPPSGQRVVVGLSLRAPRKTPIEVVVDEFPAGGSPNIILRTVPATARWRHYTFSARVEGRWLGLGMYVGSDTNGVKHKWFAVRGLTAAMRH